MQLYWKLILGKQILPKVFFALEGKFVWQGRKERAHYSGRVWSNQDTQAVICRITSSNARHLQLSTFERSNGISSYNTARLSLGWCADEILIEWLADAFVNREGEMKQAEENTLTRISPSQSFDYLSQQTEKLTPRFFRFYHAWVASPFGKQRTKFSKKIGETYKKVG